MPLISLRDHELEEVPTWQRKTHNPKHQRKRQEKVDKVETKNKAKQIQMDGKYQDIQNKRVQCKHGFAEAKTVHGLDRARSRVHVPACRNMHSVPPSFKILRS